MAAYKNLTDDDLLHFYRTTGDMHSIGTLLQRYTLLLFGVAMKYLRDKEAAQDAVQAVFLKALTNMPQGPIQNFKGWLYILTRNHCLQILRDRPYLAPEETLQYLAAAEDESDQLMLKEVTLARLQQALTAIPEDQRKCIDLFYLQKKSYQQIEDSTGFTFAQVKSHIQNGKRNLKIILLKQADADTR